MQEQARSTITGNKTATFLIIAFVGICLFAWAAWENLPATFLTVNLWLIATIVPVLGFLLFRIRLDPLYGLMVLGIPIGIIFSIIELVGLLQELGDPTVIALAVSTALSFAFSGGLFSAIGYFGYREVEMIHSKKLKILDFLLVTLFLFAVWVGVMVTSTGLGAFVDLPSIQIALAITLIGTGIAKFKEIKVLNSLPNIFICVALIGAAFSTIGWIMTSLTSDLQGVGPAMAVGLLTMLYGIILYILSFTFFLTTGKDPQTINFTTKNWHIVEGFTFLFFMTLGPPTLFEVFSERIESREQELSQEVKYESPDFTGTVLEVENHEKNEKVIISIEK